MRRIALLTMGMLLLAACGVGGDGPVQRIANEDVPFGLADTTTSTSTTTSTTVPESTTTSGPTTTLPTEPVQLYFVDGGRLSPLAIPLTSPASLNQVLFALQQGPPAEAPTAGLRTAFPGVVLAATQDGTGVATVDLPIDFFEVVTGIDQRLAVAQIVLTLASRPGVGQVRFTQNGEPAVVQRGSGALAAPGEPLAVRDYAALLAAPVSADPIEVTPTATTTAP